MAVPMNADDLMEIAHGYQRSMILFAALDLGVFAALSGGPAGVAAVARKVSAEPGRTAVLLDALAAMGVLRKSGGKYRNAAAAASLLPGAPGGRSSILLHHLDCWADWSRLAAKIRAGRKGRGAGKAPGYQENFIRGMEENARERAVAVAGRERLSRGERVLDLGGGPGTYAVEWAKRYPGAAVTVFDMPETLRVTRRILREKGASRLVSLLAGDFLRDPIGGPYDLVWISHILHAYSEKDCLAILRKARAALSEGGRVAVQEFILGEDGVSPPGPALFSVHMVAVTEGGRSYTAREIAAMMRAAGLRKVSAGTPDARGVGIVRGVAG